MQSSSSTCTRYACRFLPLSLQCSSQRPQRSLPLKPRYHLTPSLSPQVQTSCGYGVPLFNPASPASQQQNSPNISSEVAATVTDKSFAGDNKWRDRDTLANWAHTRIERNELLDYQAANNAASLDGLPGLRTAIREKGQNVWVNVGMAKVRSVLLHQWEGVLVGLLLGVLVLMLVKGATGWVVGG